MTTFNGWLHPMVKPSPELLTNHYAEQVVQGNIIAGEYVIKQCQQHLDDIEKVKDPTYKWTFDKEKAHRIIRFIERFCKPSKGNFGNVLILQPWQHFVLGCVFGWVDKVKGLRRYKEALFFMGRKNGKTTLISAVANYCVSKDGENGAEINLLANSMKQARLLFDESKAMIKESPQLRDNFRALQSVIHYDKTNSKIEPQARDSEKLDGLNSHVSIFDELHEAKDYKLINVIKNSRGAREQPLIIYITTAGYQLTGPLVDMVEQGKDVLDGVYEDERTFYYLAMLDDNDDMDDSSTWIKANPNLGVSMNLQVMEEDWRAAKRTPSERGDFITKRFNLFVNSDSQSFIDYETITKNNKEMDLQLLEGVPCTLGYDLSETNDFTSAVLEFPLADGSVFVHSHSWVPKEKAEQGKEKIPFEDWQREGYLTICDGPYVDYQDVYDWILEMNQRFPIEMITYDRANAYKLNQELINAGFETQEVRQGSMTLSPPLKDLAELFADGKIIYNNNPMLKWYFSNVKLIKDRNGNWLPTKQHAFRKIDGFAAFLNSHSEVMKKMVLPMGTGEIEMLSVKDLLN